MLTLVMELLVWHKCTYWFNVPSAYLVVGRLCELMETVSSSNIRQSCNDLQPYVTSLERNPSCNTGTPGTLVWTPDENTSRVVYYQVQQTLPAMLLLMVSMII